MNRVDDAKVTAFEITMSSARAKVDVIIAQIEVTLQEHMTHEEWLRSMRGLWPDFSEDSALEDLFEAFNDYLGLQTELWEIRSYLADQLMYEKYLD